MITLFWFIASLFLAMALLEAEDPGLPIGESHKFVDGHEIDFLDPDYNGEHQGEFPPVPLWLKTANVITMPVDYILPKDGFKVLSDHANGLLYFCGMFTSSVLWGFVIVFFSRQVARQFRPTKARASHEAASHEGISEASSLNEIPSKPSKL